MGDLRLYNAWVARVVFAINGKAARQRKERIRLKKASSALPLARTLG